jgi:hypothetical protein
LSCRVQDLRYQVNTPTWFLHSDEGFSSGLRQLQSDKETAYSFPLALMIFETQTMLFAWILEGNFRHSWFFFIISTIMGTILDASMSICMLSNLIMYDAYCEHINVWTQNIWLNRSFIVHKSYFNRENVEIVRPDVILEILTPTLVFVWVSFRWFFVFSSV